MNSTCPHCKIEKSSSHYVCLKDGVTPFISICNECSDAFYIENVNCTCSVCHRSLPPSYFQHYRTRFKSNGMRLRVNRNCKDCSKKESSVLRKLKKDNPPPSYLTACPQCNRVVYEKSEDIPAGIDGANGPWQCDHDHLAGTFRGWLCKQCNTGSGLVGDNHEYWSKAVERNKIKNSPVCTNVSPD